MRLLRSLQERHERLKSAIHGTRIPLSRNGRLFMGAFYFSAPVVAGYYMMQWAQHKAETNPDLQARHSEVGSTPISRSVKAQNDQLRQILHAKK
ncbi:unnamed protein product [Albugo candida]|uniref:Uncharacterized protein n=1 Tax=Albugo candida TaxID=65357 RepID=A0A024GBA0_9STRA|nr:unnamed protein product [Albugo candida]|eukprot:CCI43612.1 unnamed protein product [Albugo candida]